MLIVLGIIFLGVLGFLLFFLDGFFGKLDFASGRWVPKQVVGIICRRNLRTANFVDLGSGWGGFVLKIARVLPGMRVCGVDDDSLRVFWARFRAAFYKNLSFKKENIFDTDVSSADVIYVYLPQELMPALEVKLQKELKHGCLVISNSVHFETWQPSEILITHPDKPDFQKLFIYAVN
jgi:hypothetical protein